MGTKGAPERWLDNLRLEREELLKLNLRLELSHDHYTRLYNFAPASYLTLNEAGRILKINPVGARLLGRSGACLEGQAFRLFITDSDRRKFLRHLALCRQWRGDRFSTELWLKSDENPLASCVELITTAPARRESEPLIYHSVLIDITRRKQTEKDQRVALNYLEQRVREQTKELALSHQVLKTRRAEHKRAERELWESEERWRLMVEGTQDHAIFMLDPRGHVVTWNSAAQQVKGYRVDEILGRHFSCFYTTEDIGRKLPDRLLKRAASEGRVEVEGWRVRNDQSRFWASVVITALRDPGGHLRGFLKVTRDITTRMQTEAALRKSEARLTDFFERSPVGLVWAGPDERIQRVNHAWLALAGCPRPEDCLNRRLSEFFLDPRTATHLLDQLQQHQVVHDSRAHICCADGSLRPILVDADGFWENGRLVHIRCFIRDLTRRVQLEREVLQATEREQRRIGRDLHDDLCQQLTGIEYLSQTLAGELARHYPAATGRAKEIAGMIREVITRTRGLARGLSPVQLETMGLPGALQELSRSSSKLFGIKCRFHCRRPFLNQGDAVSVHLYRIAQEAVGNAIKHGKASHVDIDVKHNQGELILSVSDNGVGIPERISKQQGMGLRVMQYRADVIGGTLLVRRNRKGGTSVVCTVKNSDGQAMPSQSV